MGKQNIVRLNINYGCRHLSVEVIGIYSVQHLGGQRGLTLMFEKCHVTVLLVLQYCDTVGWVM